MMSSLHCMYIGHPGVVLFSLLFSLYANDCFSKDLSVRIVMFDDGLKSALSRTQMWGWTAGPVGQSDQPRAEYAQNCSSNSGVEESLSIMLACQDLKWSLSIDTIIKKAEQSLRQLRRFNLPQEVMIYSTLQ